MSARNKSKAKIQISKPELPPFLQRMKEQIVANEDNERREASERKRKSGGHRGNSEDEPTIVRIGDEDLTEDEYKRLKLELDSQYKLDDERKTDKIEELDIDSLIKSRSEIKPASSSRRDDKGKKPSESGKSSDVKPPKSSKAAKTKQLSYGFSSDDDDDDDDDENER